MVDAGRDVRSWWLVRLRWGSVAGQALIILTAWGLVGLDLPVTTLLGLTAAMGISNAALWLWLRRRREPLAEAWTAAILAFDILQLTALLYITGGASNPFSVFYLVQITAAAVTLGSRWTWLLAACGVSTYAALFAMPPDHAAMGHGEHDFAGHLQAMWVALTLAAALTAFFVTRLTTSLAARDRELAAMRDAAARRDRLSALTTLAAGAAHELATPLTTVAVAAGELEREVGRLQPGEAGRLADDVRLIRSEVARCREILDGMSAGSGSPAGEMPTRFTPEDLARAIQAGLSRDAAVRITVTGTGASALLCLPRRAVERVAASLVKNALDASGPGKDVSVEIAAGHVLDLRVRDEGVGMTPDVLVRAGEPFFTTKPPGEGLGLGLFLARSLADQLGGRFTIESAPSRGTTARLELPWQVQAHGE